MTKTFKIFTFGCKTNQQESDFISQELKSIGFVEKDKKELTDFTVINSCTVTSKADDEILYLIRKQKKLEPHSRIIMTGCLAQVDAENLSKMPEIYMVLGNSEKLRIKDFILKDDIQCVAQNLLLKTDFDEFNLHKTKKTRATLKIQDGCNNFCTYCIVPFARGKSRSSHVANVINNIKDYVNNGYLEIVLSAIHLGLWGLDFEPKMHLVDLLFEIEKIDGLKRYRLGSLDPGELTPDLIEFLIKSKKLCNHLHVSLQSACDKTLSNMNRHYSVNETINKLYYLNKNIPWLNIGADVIVGFPGETDNDFEETYNNIKSMPIKYMHIFPYSQRKYTKAISMPNQVDEKIKKERAKILKKLATDKKNLFLSSLIGTSQEVLVEHNKTASNLYKGVSSNYIKFVINSDVNIANKLVMACPTEIQDGKMFAKVNIS